MSLVDEGPPDGRPWVLVHGIPGSARDFRWFTPALRLAAPSDRIVRLEMPGFGATPLQTEPDPSVEARARYVCEVVGIETVEGREGEKERGREATERSMAKVEDAEHNDTVETRKWRRWGWTTGAGKGETRAMGKSGGMARAEAGMGGAA